MKAVAYYRVSTKRQGESGLGLEAQEAIVTAHCQQTGAALAGTFVEVESGRDDRRPKLAAALAHARRIGATLVVAKLDRLARNVAFLCAVMDSGVEFVACDNPHANRLTLQILAVVAEDEARRISERTKAALAVAKRRGVKLGSARPGHWVGHEEQRRRGAAKGAVIAGKLARQRYLKTYADLIPEVEELIVMGCTIDDLVEALNDAGHTVSTGAPWHKSTVSRLLHRNHLSTHTRCGRKRKRDKYERCDRVFSA